MTEKTDGTIQNQVKALPLFRVKNGKSDKVEQKKSIIQLWQLLILINTAINLNSFLEILKTRVNKYYETETLV